MCSEKSVYLRNFKRISYFKELAEKEGKKPVAEKCQAYNKIYEAH